MNIHETPFYIYIPFIFLLLSIAVLPLAASRFWNNDRNKAIITFILAFPVALYLIYTHPHELMVKMEEYISFILLLAALYIISGGVLVSGDLRATPANNTLLLLLGAVLSNLVGTTGASMLLIRPLLKSIRERKHINHIPVFFIFVVSNIGGSLTPLGDPPLFIGYLKGIPFLWNLKLLPLWCVATGLLLIIFFAWDTICYRRESGKDLIKDNTEITPIRISGGVNFIFLVIVIFTVFFRVATPYRELLITGMILLSLKFTPSGNRRLNGFTFHPITEVAVLFAGIFVTMIPLLMLLKVKGAELGITEPWQFFWLTGGLSSFLDNAPTYITFATLAESLRQGNFASLPMVAGIREDLLIAISSGAVFMGALTYIGNGPNFMVKAIAEHQGVKMPHFFKYMIYSLIILIPIFLLITRIFFR